MVLSPAFLHAIVFVFIKRLIGPAGEASLASQTFRDEHYLPMQCCAKYKLLYTFVKAQLLMMYIENGID